MATRILTLVVLLPMQMGCGSTWSRASAVEVPLHRSVWGLQPDEPPCTLDEDEWEERCTPENFGNFDICPPGCPLSESKQSTPGK